MSRCKSRLEAENDAKNEVLEGMSSSSEEDEAANDGQGTQVVAPKRPREQEELVGPPGFSFATSSSSDDSSDDGNGYGTDPEDRLAYWDKYFESRPIGSDTSDIPDPVRLPRSNKKFRNSPIDAKFFKNAENAIASDHALTERNKTATPNSSDTDEVPDNEADLSNSSDSDSTMDKYTLSGPAARHFYIPAKRVKRSGKLLLRKPRFKPARKPKKEKTLEQFRNAMCKAVPPESRTVIIVYDIPTAHMNRDDLRRLFIRYGVITNLEICWDDTIEQAGATRNNFAYIQYRRHWSAKMACSELHDKNVIEDYRIKVWRLFDFEL